MQCSWQLVPLVSASAAEPALADTINNSKHANGGAIFKYVLSLPFSPPLSWTLANCPLQWSLAASAHRCLHHCLTMHCMEIVAFIGRQPRLAQSQLMGPFTERALLGFSILGALSDLWTLTRRHSHWQQCVSGSHSLWTAKCVHGRPGNFVCLCTRRHWHRPFKAKHKY